jgi:hypothetical protein
MPATFNAGAFVGAGDSPTVGASLVARPCQVSARWWTVLPTSVSRSHSGTRGEPDTKRQAKPTYRDDPGQRSDACAQAVGQRAKRCWPPDPWQTMPCSGRRDSARVRRASASRNAQEDVGAGNPSDLNVRPGERGSRTSTGLGIRRGASRAMPEDVDSDNTSERSELGLAGSTGLEPAASGVTGRRSNQLNYDPKRLVIRLRASARQPSRCARACRAESWWAVRVSNPRQPACKAGALPLS